MSTAVSSIYRSPLTQRLKIGDTYHHFTGKVTWSEPVTVINDGWSCVLSTYPRSLSDSLLIVHEKYSHGQSITHDKAQTDYMFGPQATNGMIPTFGSFKWKDEWYDGRVKVHCLEQSPGLRRHTVTYYEDGEYTGRVLQEEVAEYNSNTKKIHLRSTLLYFNSKPQVNESDVTIDRDYVVYFDKPFPSQLRVLDSLWNPDPIGYPAAFQAACSGVPALHTNNIANACEVLSALKGGFSPKKLKHMQLKDAWLSYRYSYCTTASDIREFREKGSPVLASLTHGAVETFHGVHHENGYTHTVAVKAKDTTGITTGDLNDKLRRLGLALTPYTAWDMIPYSFVADWFLPIGDILESYDLQNMFAGTGWDISEIWYTCSKTFSFGNNVYRRFTRSLLTDPPNQLYVAETDPSGETWAKRALDGLCLFVAR